MKSYLSQEFIPGIWGPSPEPVNEDEEDTKDKKNESKRNKNFINLFPKMYMNIKIILCIMIFK